MLWIMDMLVGIFCMHAASWIMGMLMGLRPLPPAPSGDGPVETPRLRSFEAGAPSPSAGMRRAQECVGPRRYDSNLLDHGHVYGLTACHVPWSMSMFLGVHGGMGPWGEPS